MIFAHLLWLLFCLSFANPILSAQEGGDDGTNPKQLQRSYGILLSIYTLLVACKYSDLEN